MQIKNEKIKIVVIIATSLGRIDELFNRSLPSVLNQTRKPDFILVVDDNNDVEISKENEARLLELQKRIGGIYYIKNSKTKGMSGTGAWNSGFEWCKKYITNNDYIAILDDDDRWERNYLKECELKIFEKRYYPDQIVAFLKRSDLSEANFFELSDLCIENFLIGNPGVQGSNMFFRFGAIININGFDENLSSCTDRDIMIRFLSQKNVPKISIIPKVLINHFAGSKTITYDFIKKEKGLDYFYRKYISLYTKDLLEKSLLRSEKLFSYKNSKNIRKLWKLEHIYKAEEKIVIGIATHNNESTIRNSLLSVLKQKELKSKLWILIVDDNSDNDWKMENSDLLENDRVIYWNVNFCNVSKVRNYINTFIKTYFGNVKLIGRLDADDEYFDEFGLSKIEKLKDSENADVIFAGNYLKYNGKILTKVNYAEKELENHDYLLKRLKEMAEGTAENELPSCNTFMTLKSLKKYPDMPSAEDHFLTSRLLWNKDGYKLAFAEKELLTIYNLNGKTTNMNKEKNIYTEARKQLFREIESYGKI